MGCIKSPVNWAPIRIFLWGWKQSFLVQFPIVIIYSVVKSDVNKLRGVFGIQPTRYKRTIHRAKTIGQWTVSVITERSSVGIVLWVAPPFITAVKTVWKLINNIILNKSSNLLQKQTNWSIHIWVPTAWCNEAGSSYPRTATYIFSCPCPILTSQFPGIHKNCLDWRHTACIWICKWPSILLTMVSYLNNTVNIYRYKAIMANATSSVILYMYL